MNICDGVVAECTRSGKFCSKEDVQCKKYVQIYVNGLAFITHNSDDQIKEWKMG